MDGGEVVVAGGVEDFVFGDGAGGDDAGDFAADDAFGLGGVFHLVADGGLLAGADEFGEVGVNGVVGDAAHGGSAALGEGHAEDGGGGAGVVEKHLVEVAEPKQ